MARSTGTRRVLEGVLLIGVALLMAWWAARPEVPAGPVASPLVPAMPLPPPAGGVPAAAPAVNLEDLLERVEDPRMLDAAVRQIAEATGRTFVDCPPSAEFSGPGCGSALCNLSPDGSLVFAADQASGALGVHAITELGFDNVIRLQLVGRMVWETDLHGVTTCTEEPLDVALSARVRVVRPGGSPVSGAKLQAGNRLRGRTGDDGWGEVELLSRAPTRVEVRELLGEETEVWVSAGEAVQVELPEPLDEGGSRRATYLDGVHELEQVRAALATPELAPDVEAALLGLEEGLVHLNAWRREQWPDELAPLLEADR